MSWDARASGLPLPALTREGVSDVLAALGLYVEALWNTSIPSGKWRYYDGMSYLLALLHASGNFRIYAPATG